MNEDNKPRPHEKALTVLLWLLVADIIIGIIARVLITAALFSSGILDMFMQMLGM